MTASDVSNSCGVLVRARYTINLKESYSATGERSAVRSAAPLSVDVYVPVKNPRFFSLPHGDPRKAPLSRELSRVSFLRHTYKIAFYGGVG